MRKQTSWRDHYPNSTPLVIVSVVDNVGVSSVSDFQNKLHERIWHQILRQSDVNSLSPILHKEARACKSSTTPCQSWNEACLRNKFDFSIG